MSIGESPERKEYVNRIEPRDVGICQQGRAQRGGNMSTGLNTERWECANRIELREVEICQ